MNQDNENNELSGPRHAVFRNGFRVSSADYSTAEEAAPELKYWKQLIANWPDGSRLWVAELRPRKKFHKPEEVQT